MIRRAVGVVVILVVGVGAGYGLATGDPMAAVDAAGDVTIDAVSGPETETVVKTIRPDNRASRLTKIELYESGAANLTFKSDHGSGYKMAFGHADHYMCQERYRTWNPPEFSGPLTVDLGSIVGSHGPYPSNQFQLQPITENEDVCLETMGGTAFSVPDAWLED